MYRRVSPLFFPDPVMWIIMSLMAAGLFLWSWARDFTIIYGGNPVMFYAIAAALVMGLVYHRRGPAIAVFAFSFALFMLMSMILRPYSYLGAAEGFPVIDSQLAWFDRLIGFDWVAHVAWVNDNRLVFQLLLGAYSSLVIQLVFFFFVFYLTANFERLREFIMVFFGMGIVTTLVATFVPAIGAFHYYQPAEQFINNLAPETGRYFQAHFLALHSGQMRSVNISDSVGLIAFPSFHTQAALLYVWAARRTKMFWPVAILNSLMILSTLTFGGHYMGDLVSGFFVIAVVIFAYGVWAGRYNLSLWKPRRTKIANATGFKPHIPVLEGLIKSFRARQSRPLAAGFSGKT